MMNILEIDGHRATTTDIYLRSLVQVSTKGIKVLDDIVIDSRGRAGNIVPFNRAVNMG